MSIGVLRSHQRIGGLHTFIFAVQVAIIFIPFTSHHMQFAIIQLMEPQPDCSIKFLILVWNEKSKQFTGIIPLEQVNPSVHCMKMYVTSYVVY